MNMIKQLRVSKNRSQNELAKFIDLSQTAVSKWESGGGFPDIQIGFKFCEFFKISIDTLYSNPHAEYIDNTYSLSTAEQRAVSLLCELPDDSYRYEVIGIIRQTIYRFSSGLPNK